jgi:hypothetical protein
MLDLEEINQLKREPTFLPLPDQGVALSEIFSRETSLALASNRLTPVPRPVERLLFVVTGGRAPALSMVMSMMPTPTHPSAPTNGHPRETER